MPGTPEKSIPSYQGTDHRSSAAIFVLTQPSSPPQAMTSCTLGGISPTFCSHEEPSFSVMTTLERRMSQINFQPVRRVRTFSASSLYVSRRRCTSLGSSTPRRALLILLRLKMLPKLPATTRGICFAKMAVAACSLDDP